MHIPRVLALVLAGGKGSRLASLTDDRVKPALSVGGTYRLIDVSLSNLAHSHISDVGLIEQYLPHDLNAYIAGGRPWDLDRSHGGLQVLPPFTGGAGEGFAQGNADSLYRQRDFIADYGAELVLVMSADHLYTMNFMDVVDTHQRARADLTIVTTEIEESASRFGAVQVDHGGKVTGFDYKPDEPAGSLVATEIFLYDTQALLGAMEHLVEKRGELEDYGHDLVPHLVQTARVVEHRHHGYWMDLGTLQSYWTANLQLLDGDGATLDDPSWPIYSAMPQLSPGRIVAGSEVHDCAISAGSRVAGTARHSVINPRVVIEQGASVTDSVVLDGAEIGSGVELVNCIVAPGAQVRGGAARGSSDAVTLIGPDGKVDVREPFDYSAALPRGFREPSADT